MGQPRAAHVPPEAESLLLGGYEGVAQRRKTMDGQQRVLIPLAAGWIVDFYAASGRPDKAAEWREKTVASK
jgi:hypothetical protein